MAYCLPRALASKFLEALKDGTIEPVKLMDMTSKERADFFAKIVGDENAHHVNALFESKMLLKDQQRGMVSWAKNLAGISAPVRRDLLNKINKLDRVLNPAEEKAFLADLAATKLGTTVTYEEAQKITDLAQKATAERDKGTDTFSGASTEFLNAATALEHYVQSLRPVTAIRSIGKNLAIIGRNHLLMDPATPVKTTAGQTINTGMDMITRRIGLAALNGSVPRAVTREAKSQAWRQFRDTGFNTAMMENYEDSGRLGERHNFDVPEGMLSANPTLRVIEGGVRWYAKATNKVAIDLEHNFTFTKFYQNAFYDMLNLGSSNIAKSEGLTGAALQSRATAIYKDAARIIPATKEGQLIRMESQKQAARITQVNSTVIGNLALGMKNLINDKIMNGLGDILMPIAKIPANIIANGIENAGPGIPMGAWDIFKGREKMASADTQTRLEGAAQMARGIQRVARTIGVLGMSAFIASMFTKNDFRDDPYGNSFVKIAGHWINLEYFNAISPALTGMLMMKKDGRGSDNMLQKVGQYVSGVAQPLKHAPGINELGELVTSVTNSNFTTGVLRYAENLVTSRGLPAMLYNLFNNRPINRIFFGATGIETPGEVNQDKNDKERRKEQ